MKYNNPIIKGFNPDPSICSVGEDYYLVTSTFEFYPGVPVYHSRNLINWELMNYCLTRESQVDLKNCRNSGGIYAPTIRYYDGTFYMTTTNTSNLGNFIVSAEDITGEWSEPVAIEQSGIDPSILFDEGKAYYCSASADEKGTSCILLCEIDIVTGDKLTDSKVISYGCGGKYCEAPHIYKIGNFYYLMLAEGGTEYGHMTTIQRSKSAYGPYVPCPGNPILSHRDAMGTSVQATGHSDLFEDHKGNWWLVSLGIRTLPQVMLHNLGRETFLTPVTWSEDGWPIVGTNGRTALEMEGPLPESPDRKSEDFLEEFKSDKLGLDWNYVRNPIIENYEQQPGIMRLKGTEATLSDFSPTFIGIRQKEFHMSARTLLNAGTIQIGTCAGITAFYNKEYYYGLCLSRETDRYYIKLIHTIHNHTSEAVSIITEPGDEIELEIVTGVQYYKFFYIINKERFYLGQAATAGLTTEGTMTMTFTGTYLGIYAVNGTAEFRRFSVSEIKEEI